MMRILVPLFALSAQGVLWADPIQEILDAAPRLDAPGPDQRSQVGPFVPLEMSVKAPNPVIEYSAFVPNVGQVGRLREERRISEGNNSASLNLYTFNTLYSYGYTNVYELGPLIEIQKSMLPFEGTSVIPNK
jgi:hypothetical protein